MSKIIKNNLGLYFVLNVGFTAKTAAEATKFTADEATDISDCIKSVGNTAFEVIDYTEPTVNGGSAIQNADGTSYGVRFLRPREVKADGSIVPLGKRKPSTRTFRTPDQAGQHGARFSRLEKHAGFVVYLTKAPVNSWINESNGKTNPEIGKKRTNRV